jgi:hypothetical protein
LVWKFVTPVDFANRYSTTPESVIDVALSLKAMATTTPLVSTLTVVFSDVALPDPVEFEWNTVPIFEIEYTTHRNRMTDWLKTICSVPDVPVTALGDE